MLAAPDWQEDSPSPPPPPKKLSLAPGQLPAAVEAMLWRGTDFGNPVRSSIATGWDALDRDLPGAGWPCHSLTEILSPQPSVLEWRLLGPALRQVIAKGQQVVVVAPPRHPHLPGLRHEGIDDRSLVWIRAETPAERLWVTEQLIKANAAGALLAWLPQARAEQLRRLQVAAQGCDGPVFLIRPQQAQYEASPAPLRVQATFGLDWELCLRILKRRGPVCDTLLMLPSIPGGLASVLTPRLRTPSRLIHREAPDVVGSPVAPARPRRHASAH